MPETDLETQWVRAAELMAQGRAAQAEQAFGCILERAPDHPAALHALAILAHQRGATGDAIALARRAISSRPQEATFHNSLGVLLESQGRFAEAAAAYQQAVHLAPSRAVYHCNLALMLRWLGQVEPALTAYDRAVALEPDRAATHFNRAEMLQAARRVDEAIDGYCRVISLQPDSVQAYVNLGSLLQTNNRRAEALAMYEKAEALSPDLAMIYTNKGAVLQEIGRTEEADAAFRRANNLDPQLLGESALMFLQFAREPVDPLEIRRTHEGWARSLIPVAAPAGPPRLPRDGNVQRLRVGYVSPDFQQHPVAFFIEPLLRGHNRSAVELYLYSQGLPGKADEYTRHFRSLADRWIETSALGDRELAARIAADQIDVLVDLAGHTAGSRLPVFASRPAPVQVSYLGYPGTTGLGEMDYRLTDALLDPPGEADAWYTEKLVRLPNTFACYSPPAVAPAVEPPPVLERRAITFGVLARPFKASSTAVELWAAVLRAVPESRLRLFGYADDPAMWERVLAGLTARGIARDRIETVGKLSLAQYMAAHHQIDIALDTLPFNGHTTTCHALWMGVPVVSLAGRMFAGRLGLSVLTNAGLASLCASTPAQFVQIAADLAGDVPRLKALRASMRDTLRASPLMKGPALAAHVEAAYRQMYSEAARRSSR